MNELENVLAKIKGLPGFATSSNIDKIITSMKGLSGTGTVLGQAVKGLTDFLLTLEPGDIVRSDTNYASAAPLAPDLWYLRCHKNFMNRYYDAGDGTPAIAVTGGQTPPDGDHANYSAYMAGNLGFLASAEFSPIKTFRDLASQLIADVTYDVHDRIIGSLYENSGIYWINTIAFELWQTGQAIKYASDGPDGFVINDYVGYLTFPVGTPGVQEVISLIQETALSGYPFAGVDGKSAYHSKPAHSLTDEEKPIAEDAGMFCRMTADKNRCYGRHLVESGYLAPDVPVASQNTLNSSGTTAYAPNPKGDVELFSDTNKDYGEDVSPKKWMRYWIHKDSTMPIPGEFIGILCKPVTVPPHVWWFQESAPFVYAGNWVEMQHLTSGVITSITGTGYGVKVQGCEIIIESSDYLAYSVGDRVAVLKTASLGTGGVGTPSYTWLGQPTFKDEHEGAVASKYIIIPATFYKRIN
jgi:hypothetical protein